MEEERLSLLKAAVEAQKKEIDRIFAKIEKRHRGAGEAYVESLAYQLHNLYCAFEDLFKIVEDFSKIVLRRRQNITESSFGV